MPAPACRSMCMTRSRNSRSRPPASASCFSRASARPKPRRPRLPAAGKAEQIGNIGLPLPGLELKLVPNEGKLETRMKGPNITPGYWRAPALTAAAFDDEGFYKIGDALKFVDAGEPAKGLLFDGRIAEDFKLATGTWVSVGPLRMAVITQCAPLVRDVVLAGPDRDDLAALIIPDVEACRKLAPDLPPDAAPAVVLAHPQVRTAFERFLARAVRPAPRHVGARRPRHSARRAALA